jgi:hypothetical protein
MPEIWARRRIIARPAAWCAQILSRKVPHIFEKFNSPKIQKVFSDLMYDDGTNHDPKRLSPNGNSNYWRLKDSPPKTFWDFPPKNTVQMDQKCDRT